MATAAEPKPAELPLTGGRPGATVKLTPLLCGKGVWSEPWRHRESGRLAPLKAAGFFDDKSQRTEYPIVAFLVEHPGAGPMLIDTGLHPSVAVDKKQNVGRLLARTVARSWQMEPSQALPDQLRERGIQPSEIRYVVMTHLHLDHASGMVQFPDATFVFSRQEWQKATEPRPWRNGYVPSQFDHAFDYRLLDFDDPAVGSFASFARSFDLLGDESVRVVFTPGHTVGHVSVVLRTAEREVLVAGDAIYTEHALATGHEPFVMQDEHLFARSLREIRRYAEQTPSAVVIPGHDMKAWESLKPAYG